MSFAHFLLYFKTSTRASNDFIEPSRIKDASSAKRDFLNSYFEYVIPLISSVVVILYDKSVIHIMKR